MVDGAEPISAGIAASEQDVLLATKLHLPHRQPGFVPRPRLVETLDGARAGGLALVCAPAGFGKTALLADWARRGERAVAWLSLDAGDSDPARFWRHVVAALDRVRAENSTVPVTWHFSSCGDGQPRNRGRGGPRCPPSGSIHYQTGTWTTCRELMDGLVSIAGLGMLSLSTAC
jgi:hypothetical protein